MRTIGERIKARREQLQLSQEELAKKMGYKSRSSINKIEMDSRNLTQSKIKAIADALETTPSYIMGWEEQEEEIPQIQKLTEGEEKLLELYRLIPVEQQEMVLGMIEAALSKLK